MTKNSQPKQWTVEKFQGVANELLSTHYGIGIDDTFLWDTDIVEEVIAGGFQPFQVVQEHAQEADMDRIDASSWTGQTAYPPLTEQDQAAAAQRVQSKDRACRPKM